MANAATIAGLAVGNTNISLAHAMSHSVGGIFPIPHGRIAGLILPYTVEYTANGGLGRYLDLTHLLGLPAVDEAQAGSPIRRGDPGPVAAAWPTGQFERRRHRPTRLRR